MGIKDEEFITEKVSFGKFIDRIYRNNNYYVGKHLEKYNLNKSEYKYLIQIYLNEGICQDDIVNRLKVDKYEVARGIKSLIEKGYVYKEKDSIDKRKHRLYITEKGNSIRDGFTAILRESSEILTKGFKEEEKDLVLGFLIRMAQNICEETIKLKNNK
ncbi:MarR family winged helix-turn-helix transcriptional regulator [Tepidibacter aestuarii]|uniref:MarR family winged helix-turn-helix transcriptional regulator n=1 Tax=Tepidibacter aestuarii TaxID=2925782 RepID=UPI0020BF9DFE|nr:MarR family transcriptional regulator [Tepidibacter aestuarii]CAH2214950.1 DNA-binding transcriptional regulator, MarR family [Tepidibacter aestuarii]